MMWLLEYNYNTGGSDFPLLSWELRIIIALGAAKGLAYIHSPKINVIHGDITASNILIDSVCRTNDC